MANILKVAKWDSISTKILLDICVEEIRKLGRPGIAFKSKIWEGIRDEFHKRANKDYTQKQLKNKMDTLRDNWSTWKQLVGKETGLGWNHQTGTVEADDTWWDCKIRENPSYKKFRFQGLEFIEELRFIFGEIVATSETAWTPTMHIPTQSNLDVSHEVESAGMEINLDDDITPRKNSQPNKKRKALQDIDDKLEKGKSKVGSTTNMQKAFERLIKAVESSNEFHKEEFTAISHFHGPFSIPTCVEALKSLKEGGLLNAQQFLYALELIKDSKNRAIFISLKDSMDDLVEWLLHEYEKYKLWAL